MSQISPNQVENKESKIFNVKNDQNQLSSSPLKPAYQWIKWGSRLTCPLKTTDKECMEFKTVNSVMNYYRAVNIGSTLITVAIHMVAAYYGGIGMADLLARLNESGLTTLDLVAQLGVYIPLFGAGAYEMIRFLKLYDPLTRFCRKMTTIPHGIAVTSDEAQAIFCRVRRHQMVILLALVASAYLVAYALMFAISEIIQMSTLAFCLIVFVYGSLLTFNFLKQAVIVIAYVVLHQSLGTTEIAFKKCADMFLDEKTDLNKILDVANHLADILEILEEAFGSVIFVEISSYMVCQIFGFFFGVQIFTCFSGGVFQRNLFFGGLAFHFIAIISAIKMKDLLDRGQGISNQVSMIKKHFMVLHDHPSSDDAIKSRIATLFKRWSQPSPIRPKDVFDLNHSTGVSIAGSLLTYIIVLWELKSRS